MHLQSLGLPSPATPPPGHKHVLLLIDVSCSMTGELPGITADLHRHLLEHLNPGDELSVVWFSGRDECGTVLAHETVSSLAQSQRVAELIGRWLVPVGTTSFTNALRCGASLAARSTLPTSVVFMSDGQDNQNPPESILQAARDLATHIRDAQIVEYGDHADRRTLTGVAGILGASQRRVQGAEEYHGVTAQALSLPPSAPKIEVLVGEAQYVSVRRDEQVIIYQADQGRVLLPADAQHATPFTALPRPDELGGKPEGTLQDALYAHLMLAARTLDGPEIERTLRLLGDRALIQMMGGLFGKQRFGHFEAVVEEMCARPERRYPLGYDPGALPDESAPTITEVLEVLSDGSCVLLTRHPDFQYRRVSRATQRETRPALSWSSGGETRITGLTSHARRPNLSLQVMTPGTVHLAHKPQALTDQLPDSLDTARIQNYTVLHSGILHLLTLPVRPSAAALTRLKAWGLIPANTAAGEPISVNLSRLPLVRRSEVQRVRAEDYARLTVQHEREKAALKVLREACAQHFLPRTSAQLADTYGRDAATWLREQGLTDQGFSPRGTSLPGKDDVQMVEMEATIKGVSSLPKTSDVTARIRAGKPLTLRERMIRDALALVPADPAELQDVLERHRQKAREASDALLRHRMALLIGQTWFTDLDPGDTEVNVTEGGETFTVRLSTREVTESI